MTYPTIALLCLLCVVGISHADSRFEGDGSVAGFPIEMQLDLNEGGKIDGYYIYKRIGRSISLRGHLDGESIHLESQSVDIQEVFDGSVIRQNGDLIRIAGHWRQVGKEHISSFVVANQPDPYSDNHISCEEMESSPAMVFRNDVDLGSGFGSPNTVDFECSKNLTNLDFLKPLLALSYSVREASSGCSGTMRYAEARYFALELAKLGYFPQSDLHEVGESRGERYFEEWSFQSLYNRSIYLNYLKLRDVVRPKLADWYERNAIVDYDTASKYADRALNTISDWAFGSYSSRWVPEPLVPHTAEVLQGKDTSAFVKALGSADKIQKINSLRRLVASNPDISLIRAVLANTPDVAETGRSESPLSLSLMDPMILAQLLQSGFDPNHQNEFGKTPLYYAIDFNHLEAVKLLLSSGADINHGYQEADQRDVGWNWGCTSIEHWNRSPLMHAAQHADVTMLELLLAAGADINARDSLGKTALDYAKENDRAENAEYLLRQ